MSTPSLNLLRYPRRWPLVGRFTLASAVAGLCGGYLLVAAWGLWCQHRHPDWLAQRQQLQAQLAGQTRAQAEAQAKVQHDRALQKLLAQRQEWQLVRQQLQTLHERLGELSLETGLRLQRWQGDGQRMQLQAWLPQAQSWSALQARLMAPGAQTWSLGSLTSGSGPGVHVVLETSPVVPVSGGERR